VQQRRLVHPVTKKRKIKQLDIRKRVN
jgi:hypothetical protein